MPKLCQCIRKKLLDRLWDIPDPYEDLVDQQLEDIEKILELEDIEKILESDCVCENKEEVLEDPSTWPTVTIDQETNTVSSKGKVNVVIQTKMFDLKEEKQSQSPCEHEYREVCTTNIKLGCVDLSLWCCYKCGLVTCKNPNDK